MENKSHPLQPLIQDQHGTLRFKANAIVQFLLEHGPHDLNKLALMDFSDEDRIQFAQLVGYSLSGFSELSYVDDATYEQAEQLKNNLFPHLDRPGGNLIDSQGPYR
jgi:hypothetical protein